MTNLELIDDYLSNRMTGDQRKAFEQRLEADPTLRSDVEMQQHIVEGIRTARTQELKTMLRNVPIETGVFSLSSRSILRMAAGVAGIGVLVAATFYYIRSNRTIPVDSLSTDFGKQLPLVKPAEKTAAATEPLQIETPKAEKVDKGQPIATKPSQSIQKPSINVVDPTAELTEESVPQVPTQVETPRGTIAVADVHVSVDRSNKQYAFHYQFEQGGLRLFGPFDSGLFEVLEVQGEGRSLFLFYQSNYYSLSERQTQITKLEAVTNPKLLQLLKEYHQR
jgi:hypothetical protein